MALVTQRVAGERVGQLGHRADVAGAQVRYRDLLLTTHHVDLAQPLLFLGPAVVDAAIRFGHSAVDAEVGQFTHIGISRRLEDQRRQRSQFVGLDLLFPCRSLRRDRPAISRRWGVGDQRVQQRPRAQVCRRRRHQDRYGRPVEDGSAQPPLDLLLGQFLPFQVFQDQFIVRLGGGLDQRDAGLLRLAEYVGRDLGGLPLRPHHRPHLHQVYHARELALRTDGELNGDEILPEGPPQRLQRTTQVGVLPVHLVDDDHPGQRLLLGEVPDQLRPYLDAGYGVHQNQRQVSHPDRTLDLADEVGVARGIQHVDFAAFPFDRNEGQAKRDATTNLLLIEVGDGSTRLDLSHAVDRAAGKKHRLR